MNLQCSSNQGLLSTVRRPPLSKTLTIFRPGRPCPSVRPMTRRCSTKNALPGRLPAMWCSVYPSLCTEAYLSSSL